MILYLSKIYVVFDIQQIICISFKSDNVRKLDYHDFFTKTNRSAKVLKNFTFTSVSLFIKILASAEKRI